MWMGIYGASQRNRSKYAAKSEGTSGIIALGSVTEFISGAYGRAREINSLLAVYGAYYNL